jgi:hypothetical protein
LRGDGQYDSNSRRSKDDEHTPNVQRHVYSEFSHSIQVK